MKCANCGKKFGGIVIQKQKKANQVMKKNYENVDTTKILGMIITTMPECGIRFQHQGLGLDLSIDACEHCGVLQIVKKEIKDELQKIIE